MNFWMFVDKHFSEIMQILEGVGTILVIALFMYYVYKLTR